MLKKKKHTNFVLLSLQLLNDIVTCWYYANKHGFLNVHSGSAVSCFSYISFRRNVMERILFRYELTFTNIVLHYIMSTMSIIFITASLILDTHTLFRFLYWSSCENHQNECNLHCMTLAVTAYWLRYCAKDQKISGSSPTTNRLPPVGPLSSLYVYLNKENENVKNRNQSTWMSSKRHTDLSTRDSNLLAHDIIYNII